MAGVLADADQDPLVLHTWPVVKMSDGQFFRFCRINPDLRIERTTEGDLVVMSPTGGSSGRANAKLIFLLEQWAREDGTGQVFDSSTGFKLPNGAIRSPDLSWVSNEKLERLSQKQWDRFLPVCPDFVVELKSPTDSLKVLKSKMAEYIENGAQLGWLLDAPRQRVHIYKSGLSPEIVTNPKTIAGDPILTKFVLDLRVIWEAMKPQHWR